jgi:hypothetical protein
MTKPWKYETREEYLARQRAGRVRRRVILGGPSLALETFRQAVEDGEVSPHYARSRGLQRREIASVFYRDLVSEMQHSEPYFLGPAMWSLNKRQRKFVEELLNAGDNNCTAAARRAGYSDLPGSASIRVLAHRLSNDLRILAAIEEERERRVTIERRKNQAPTLPPLDLPQLPHRLLGR